MFGCAYAKLRTDHPHPLSTAPSRAGFHFRGGVGAGGKLTCSPAAAELSKVGGVEQDARQRGAVERRGALRGRTERHSRRGRAGEEEGGGGRAGEEG